jgi:hypothetical protein
VQLELDRLAATLKQVESYNEAMKGEIAVTRRAAYAAEGAVARLEKDKLEQDFQIDALQVRGPPALPSQVVALYLYSSCLPAG